MSRRLASIWFAMFTLALLWAPRAAVAAEATVARFAIVIGNNEPDAGAETRPTLKYADDDAVATHTLLSEAAVDAVLLVTVDEDTRRLHPGLHPRGPARMQVLEQAVTEIHARIRQAAARGEETELLWFYSGHGGVDGAEGHVVLEDGLLTRTKLYQYLANSPAKRNHVFVDACSSFYLVYQRGPGGQRESYLETLTGDAVPGALRNTGFVLSTSSERDSHEWARYEAGIFSHEVRSALRGAADANADGRITYAELGAFLIAANDTIPVPRFRPEFMLQAPNRNPRQDVLSWKSAANTLEVDGGSSGHIYVESSKAERQLDAHPGPGQYLRLHVSGDRPVYVRTVPRPGTRDEEKQYALETGGDQPVQLQSLRPEPIGEGVRGPEHLAFAHLFEQSFGTYDVEEFERASPTGRYPDAIIDSGRPFPLRTIAGAVALGAAAGAVTLGAVALERSLAAQHAPQQTREQARQTILALDVAWGVCAGVAGVAGATWWWLGKSPPVSVRVWNGNNGSPEGFSATWTGAF